MNPAGARRYLPCLHRRDEEGHASEDGPVPYHRHRCFVLTVSAVLKRQLQKDRAFPKKERLLSFFLWDMGLFPQWRADAKDTERMQEACIDTAFMQSGEVSDKKKNSADFTKNLHKNSQIVESCKLENIVIAFFVKSAIISA